MRLEEDRLGDWGEDGKSQGGEASEHARHRERGGAGQGQGKDRIGAASPQVTQILLPDTSISGPPGTQGRVGSRVWGH